MNFRQKGGGGGEGGSIRGVGKVGREKGGGGVHVWKKVILLLSLVFLNHHRGIGGGGKRGVSSQN